MKKNRFIKIIILFSICLVVVILNFVVSTRLAYAAPVNSPKLKSMPINSKFINEENNSKLSQLIPQISVSKYKLGLAPAPFKLPNVKPITIAKAVLYPALKVVN